MKIAGDWATFRAWDPKVGTTSVENDLEFLGRSSKRNGREIYVALASIVNKGRYSYIVHSESSQPEHHEALYRDQWMYDWRCLRLVPWISAYTYDEELACGRRYWQQTKAERSEWDVKRCRLDSHTSCCSNGTFWSFMRWTPAVAVPSSAVAATMREFFIFTVPDQQSNERWRVN